MKKIGILYHPLREAAQALTRQMEDFLGSRGLSVCSCSVWDDERARVQMDGSDLILTIGGDGTILRAAQVAIAGLVPIVGINVGKLGFMTELSVEEARAKLPALLAGEGWIDERSLLEAELFPAGKETEPSHVFFALNDVVMARGAIARLINVATSIDDEPLTTYRADGVIVATATGSTGYSLAAGGPILNPAAPEFLLVPIVAHLGLPYAMVLASTSRVKLSLSSPVPAILSIDGHVNLQVSGGAVVGIRHSARTVRFLRIHPQASYYSCLEKKLRGTK